MCFLAYTTIHQPLVAYTTIHGFHHPWNQPSPPHGTHPGSRTAGHLLRCRRGGGLRGVLPAAGAAGGLCGAERVVSQHHGGEDLRGLSWAARQGQGGPAAVGAVGKKVTG